MARKSALQKIESHEKLCRIMQKQTHDKIHSIETQIQRIESILLITSRACTPIEPVEPNIVIFFIFIMV